MKSEINLYPTKPILLVDDEKHAVKSLELTLKTEGINHTLFSLDGQDVLQIIENTNVEMILLDIMLPKISGEKLLVEIKRKHPEITIIMTTSINEVNTAVRCMREGAFDYILKPIESERLIASVRKAIEFRSLHRENQALNRKFLSENLEQPEKFKKIVTRNIKMLKIFQYCEAIAESRHPVLIVGETGTGKDLIAETIHDLSGCKGEFVSVNVAGLDDNIFSDTLFGHEKGAFTGADRPRTGLVKKAEGGSLFLDEIGDLKEISQIKLLRLLEKNDYYPLGSDIAHQSKARCIAATSQDIEKQVETGNFRSELLYRLNTHQILVPPLRERPDDIPLLFDHFLEQAAEDFRKKKPDYQPAILMYLSQYHFPGNIRELRSIIFDAISRHKQGTLTLESFHTMISPEKTSNKSDRQFILSCETLMSQVVRIPTLKELDQILIEEAMKRCENNQKMAAHMLGITPQALNQRLKRLRRSSDE